MINEKEMSDDEVNIVNMLIEAIISNNNTAGHDDIIFTHDDSFAASLLGYVLGSYFVRTMMKENTPLQRMKFAVGHHGLFEAKIEISAGDFDELMAEFGIRRRDDNE